MLQHPIEPVAAHCIAAEPFGNECINRVAALDEVAGPNGISLPHLLRQLRFAAEASVSWRCSTEGARGKSKISHLGYAAGVVREGAEDIMKEDVAGDKKHSYSGMCWVCGKEGHRWEGYCFRKSKGCAACGSAGHFIWQCAQRKGMRKFPGNGAWRKMPPPSGEDASGSEVVACISEEIKRGSSGDKGCLDEED